MTTIEKNTPSYLDRMRRLGQIARSKTVPSEYAGMPTVACEDLGEHARIEIKGHVALVTKPKYEKGTTDVVYKDGKPSMKTVAYLPLTDGSVLVSGAGPIVEMMSGIMISQLPSGEVPESEEFYRREDEETGSILVWSKEVSKAEVDLKVTIEQEPYKYGNKGTYDAWTLVEQA